MPRTRRKEPIEPELLNITAADLDAAIRIHRENRWRLFYPESGPLARSKYPRHIEFFAAGATCRERCFLAANRVGKTEGVGAYETMLHLTGYYPEWWPGRRFARPVKAVVAGDTAKTVREIVQAKLFGPAYDVGTGMIPKEAVLRTTAKAGVTDAIDSAEIRHISGGISTIFLKSYDQRRESFQGTELDLVWLDEEPPMDIYTEAVMRTMTTNGLVLLTFTPLMGMTEVVLSYLKEEVPGRALVRATWDDVPHLDARTKEEMLATIPENLRDARSRGIPQMGAGAVYPIALERVLVDDFPIPEHWPRVYGLDVGWNRTAAVWGALDRDSGCVYLYSEHYVGAAEPSVHASAIRGRGEWIPGVVDPAAGSTNQRDGSRLIDVYREHGLNLTPADNAVSAGIASVYQALSSGTLRVFRSLTHWQDEYRLYRYDSNGRVHKERDHLMDATRYLWVSGRAIAKTQAETKTHENVLNVVYDGWRGIPGGWMG